MRAAAEFRAAIDLDPENQFAEERFQEATQQFSPVLPQKVAGRWEDSEEIRLEPTNDVATFHFSGDVKSLFTELAAAYKITVQLDDTLQTRQVRFNVDNVDLFTALSLACKVSKTMWAALGPHQMLILLDNAENHKQYDRMSLRRFILPPHSTPQEATDIVNTMRQIFDLRFLSSGQTGDTVEVRGPQRAVEACARLMEQFGNPKPQVMIDVRVYQISHMMTRNIGVHIPNTFNLFNIPAVALAGRAKYTGSD